MSSNGPTRQHGCRCRTLLPGDHLAEFMRHYMMQSGEEVAKSAIYVEQKKWMLGLSDSGVFEELSRLREASRIYAQIVGISEHSDPEVQEGSRGCDDGK